MGLNMHGVHMEKFFCEGLMGRMQFTWSAVRTLIPFSPDNVLGQCYLSGRLWRWMNTSSIHLMTWIVWYLILGHMGWNLNARSVWNKRFPLEKFFSQFCFQFSIIMFIETWSTNECDIFRIESYTTHYLNRPFGCGGYVAIRTQEEIHYGLVDAFSITSSDSEMLTLFADKILYSSCYRPPCEHILAFLEFY